MTVVSARARRVQSGNTVRGAGPRNDYGQPIVYTVTGYE